MTQANKPISPPLTNRDRETPLGKRNFAENNIRVEATFLGANGICLDHLHVNNSVNICIYLRVVQMNMQLEQTSHLLLTWFTFSTPV
jgi:hypothetical protein